MASVEVKTRRTMPTKPHTLLAKGQEFFLTSFDGEAEEEPLPNDGRLRETFDKALSLDNNDSEYSPRISDSQFDSDFFSDNEFVQGRDSLNRDSHMHPRASEEVYAAHLQQQQLLMQQQMQQQQIQQQQIQQQMQQLQQSRRDYTQQQKEKIDAEYAMQLRMKQMQGRHTENSLQHIEQVRVMNEVQQQQHNIRHFTPFEKEIELSFDELAAQVDVNTSANPPWEGVQPCASDEFYPHHRSQIIRKSVEGERADSPAPMKKPKRDLTKQNKTNKDKVLSTKSICSANAVSIATSSSANSMGTTHTIKDTLKTNGNTNTTNTSTVKTEGNEIIFGGVREKGGCGGAKFEAKGFWSACCGWGGRKNEQNNMKQIPSASQISEMTAGLKKEYKN
jgi:hypothetical protein